MRSRYSGDGQIVVPQDGSLMIRADIPHEPDVEAIKDMIARTRGRVFSVAYDVEYKLESILEHYLLGAHHRIEERKFFREEISGDLQFGRLVRLAKLIATRFDVIDRESFGRDLDEILRARNALAHGVTWLEGIPNDDGWCVGFRAFLEHKAMKLELNETQADNWVLIGRMAIQQGDELIAYLANQGS